MANNVQVKKNKGIKRETDQRNWNWLSTFPNCKSIKTFWLGKGDANNFTT